MRTHLCHSEQKWLFVYAITWSLKRQGRREDYPDRHWGRWSLPSTFPEWRPGWSSCRPSRFSDMASWTSMYKFQWNLTANTKNRFYKNAFKWNLNINATKYLKKMPLNMSYAKCRPLYSGLKCDERQAPYRHLLAADSTDDDLRFRFSLHTKLHVYGWHFRHFCCLHAQWRNACSQVFSVPGQRFPDNHSNLRSN